MSFVCFLSRARRHLRRRQNDIGADQRNGNGLERNAFGANGLFVPGQQRSDQPGMQQHRDTQGDPVGGDIPPALAIWTQHEVAVWLRQIPIDAGAILPDRAAVHAQPQPHQSIDVPTAAVGKRM